MGGWGSGPRRPGGKRRTVESCPALAVRDLAGRGLLRPGRRFGRLAWAADPPGRPGVRFTLDVGGDAGILRLTEDVPGLGVRVDHRMGPTEPTGLRGGQTGSAQLITC